MTIMTEPTTAIWTVATRDGLETFDEAYDRALLNGQELPPRGELWAEFSERFPVFLSPPSEIVEDRPRIGPVPIFLASVFLGMLVFAFLILWVAS